MGRPRNSLNVTDAERQRIRELYRAGVRIVDIARRVGRGGAVVERTVRGLKRPKPSPKPRMTKRDVLILRRVLVDGLPQAVVARRFGVTPTRVCQIVRKARERTGRSAPASDRRKPGKKGPTPASPVLTAAQRTRRDGHIVRLVVERGASVTVVARRYGISATTVRRIVRDRTAETNASKAG